MQLLQNVWSLGPGLQNKPCRGFRHLYVKTKVVGKRKGLVTYASAALDLASSTEEDTDEDTSPSLSHLMALVDLREGSGGKGYYPY
jgi:hypothetical protein